MTILYQGLLRSTASWARVGRGLIDGLLALGEDVNAVAARGFLHDPAFPLPEGLRCMTPGEAHRAAPPDVGLGFLHPPLLHRLIGSRKVTLFVWESDRVPEAWVAHLRDDVDLVVVPSAFTRDALVATGLEPEHIAVAHYGFDARLLEVAAGRGHGSPCTFLCVAAPHWRKGLRELLLAYRREFTKSDPVRLIVKSTYAPKNPRSFEIPSWPQLLGETGCDHPEAPDLEVRIESPDDADMVRCYEHADVLVSPTWGESFGLGILEGMAAGLPVITTGWGGQLEFLHDSADLLPYELQPSAGFTYEEVPGSQVAVPEVEALSQRLRWHCENREESTARGLAGREHVRAMTWTEAARGLRDTLG